MPMPTVWSERGETPWRDCAYSSILMALVFGDFNKFPLGAYTMAEREALERSDDQPNETGASLADIVVAVKRRYGLTLATSPALSLTSLLERIDIAIVVTGSPGNLPLGHTLRRWDADYVGGHAVTVINLGGGKYRWLDPMAPMKFVGDITDKATILKFAKTIGLSIFVRDQQFDPYTYTKSQYDLVVAQRDAVNAQLVAATAVNEAGKIALKDALAQLGEAEARIASAKTALG